MFIDKRLIQSRAGMTLLELVLAMTMLAIVTLGTSGFVTGTLRATKMGQQKINMQQDLNFSFRRVENEMLQLQNGRDMRYQVNFVFGAAGDLTETILIKDALANAANPPSVSKITVVYSSAVDETNPALVNYMEIQGLLAGGRVERFVVNGFKPWARLKDYDLNGNIDAADAAKRTDCLGNFSLCFAAECAPYKSGSNYQFNFDDPTVVNVSQACLDKSIFPFMELSKDRALLYLSFQPRHPNTRTATHEQKLQGFTKTVALHPVDLI